MASYVVAASLFVIGTSYLIQFVVEPPGSSVTNLEHLEMRSKGEQAMDVLLGTAGYPRLWDASSAEIDSVDRLGLIEPGTSIRIDADKFDAMARGKYATASGSNGAVDYSEAKAALGLDGFEFHLRAYPVAPRVVDSSYGVEGMEDFRVAYVGDITDETYAQSAKSEASALDNLSVLFRNKTRTSDASGDVFQDNSDDLREHLLPSLGATIQQEVLSEGAGTKFDFYRVNQTAYQGLATLNSSSSLSNGLALSSNGATLGYTKNREIRGILGAANLSGTSGVGTLGTIKWHEWVDTDRGNLSYDCGDYGFVEVSGDGGASWVKLTDTAALRSQDCSPTYTHLASMDGESVAITGAACAACVNNNNVLVAFHWVADNDNNIGYGWVIDNVQVVVTPGSAVTLRKTFEAPEYNLLIIGSAADHNAFTPEEMKAGIRDYVDDHGGRIIVLGGQSNVQWLDRLFDAAIGGSSGGLSTPDTTHPILNLPNQLSYTGYGPETPWDFSSSDDAGLFSMITGNDDTHHYLSISRSGAWGGDGDSSEGAVILTSYSPYEWNEDEARRFFANALVYGKYHYLHLEVGPPIPSSEAVASVARSGLMNKLRNGETNYTEIAFIMYVWPGASVAGTQYASAVNPLPVRDLAASASDARAWINWTPPSAIGTGTALSYEVWRGSAPNAMSLYQNITYTGFNGTFHDHNVTNGQTYWYNITVWSTSGRGTTANAVSATPLALPTAPTAHSALGGVGTITVTWGAPASTGPGTIYGYAVYVNTTTPGQYTLAGEVGNSTTYVYSAPDNASRTFTISALNARGWGPNTTATNTANAAQPAQPPTLAVTNATANQLNLVWVAPGDLGGGSLAGYRIYRSLDNITFSEHVYLNSALNLTFNDLNVNDGTSYHYRVAAVTNYGDGLNSSTMGNTTINVPGAPSDVSKTGGILGTIILGWTAPTTNGGSPITKYEIFRGNPAGTETEIGESVTTAYTDATAGAGSTWYYKVRAVNAAGEGAFSATVQLNG